MQRDDLAKIRSRELQVFYSTYTGFQYFIYISDSWFKRSHCNGVLNMTRLKL